MEYIVEESFLNLKKNELRLNTFNELINIADREYLVKTCVDGSLSPGLHSIYMEETEKTKPSMSPQAREKKKSLIVKVWDSIINFLTNIKNAVFKKSVESMGDPNRKVQVPKELMEVGNDTTKFNTALKKKKRGLFAAIAFVAIITAGIAILKRFKLLNKIMNSSNDSDGIKDAKIAQVPQQSKETVTTNVGSLKTMYMKMSKEFDEMQKCLLTNYKPDELAYMDVDAMKMNSGDTGLGELQIQAKMVSELKRELALAGVTDIQIPENPNESAKYSIVRSMIGKVGNSIKLMPSFVRGLKSVDSSDKK